MATKQPQQFSLFGSAGIEIQTTEFFAADSKPQKVTVTGIRRPTTDDSDRYVEVPGNKRTPIWKDLGGGQQALGTGPARIPILAIVDLECNGRPQIWEVSSARAARALEAAVDALPCVVTVKKQGSGTNTDYIVTKVGA